MLEIRLFAKIFSCCCVTLILSSCGEPVAKEHSSVSQPQTIAVDNHDDVAMAWFSGDASVEFAAPSPLLSHVRGRDYRSLNGAWPILVDESGTAWNYVTVERYTDETSYYPRSGMRLIEASFDSRNQLQVPGDWNSQRPDLDRYRSRVIYYKNLFLKLEQGKRYFLHFDGSNYITDLMVNGEMVGRHIGGYTAFNFDITEQLREGENEIFVRVNAHLDEHTIPTMRTSDFWKYGGIIRDVGLVVVPETYISQFHIYLADHQTNTIEGWVQLEGGHTADREIELTIADVNISKTFTTDESGRASFAFQARELNLWSSNSPQLYDVSFTLDDSKLVDQIGFRTIEVMGQEILLNGQPLRLRGISAHDESLLHAGMNHSPEDAAALLGLVKELNANFLRLAHYPHNEHTLRLADKLGLMVWSEIPIVSLIDWESRQTLNNAKSLVRSNIDRDRNRAAIILWSIANESFPQTQARLDFLSALADTTRSLDQSGRPVVSALVGNPRKEFKALGSLLVRQMLHWDDLHKNPALHQKLNAMSAALDSENEDVTFDVMIDDPLGEIVDVVGYNEYFGWYYSGFFADQMGLDEGLIRRAMLELMPRIRFRNSFDKPMIISEFGAGAKFGLRSEESLLWSEEYQAKVYRAQLEMLEKSEMVQGYSPWLLKDFRSHLRELNGVQETFNRKGLVSEHGEKKMAFEVLAEHYRLTAE